MQFWRGLNTNPFFTLEHRLLRQIADAPPRGCLARFNHWLNTLLTLVMTSAGVLLFVYQVVYALRGQFPRWELPRDAGGEIAYILTLGFLIVGGLVRHFSVVNGTSRLAATAVIRDKRNSVRWELMTLTGVNVRSYVRGKWWSVIRLRWRDWVLLGVMRAGVIVGVGPVVIGNPYYRTDMLPYFAWELLLIGVFVFALTMGNLLWTAALGVLNPMIYPRGNRPGAEAVLRLGLLLLIGAIIFPFVFLGAWLHVADDPAVSIVLTGGLMALWTLVDNGLAIGAAGMSPHTAFNLEGLGQNLLISIVVVVLALALYIGLTVLLLRVAEWCGVRYGMISAQEAAQNEVREKAGKRL